jgi:hypothetical protein
VRATVTQSRADRAVVTNRWPRTLRSACCDLAVGTSSTRRYAGRHKRIYTARGRLMALFDRSRTSAPCLLSKAIRTFRGKCIRPSEYALRHRKGQNCRQSPAVARLHIDLGQKKISRLRGLPGWCNREYGRYEYSYLIIHVLILALRRGQMPEGRQVAPLRRPYARFPVVRFHSLSPVLGA